MQRTTRLNTSLALAAAMLATGGAFADTIDSPTRPKPMPKRAPVRQLTEADAERIAAAQAKRDRKAAKRATQAAKQGEHP